MNLTEQTRNDRGMEWMKAQTLMLINFDQFHFMLRDSTNPKYKNRLKKLDASSLIALVLGSSSDTSRQPHNHTFVSSMLIVLPECCPKHCLCGIVNRRAACFHHATRSISGRDLGLVWPGLEAPSLGCVLYLHLTSSWLSFLACP